MRFGGTAPSRRISRTTAFTTAVVAAVGMLSGCGGASTPAASATATTGSGVDTATDAQILSGLTLTAAALDTVYPATTTTPVVEFQQWPQPSAADLDAIGMTALATCQADFDFSSKATYKPKQVVDQYFKASVGKGIKWVRAVTAVYDTSADATLAVKTFGSFSLTKTPDKCGSQSFFANKQYVRGLGNTNPSWYAPTSFSPPTVVAVDTKLKVAISAVAQIRGRFVVVTYTSGDYSLEQGGTYYVVRPSADTTAVASAATTALSELTDAVVNNG